MSARALTRESLIGALLLRKSSQNGDTNYINHAHMQCVWKRLPLGTTHPQVPCFFIMYVPIWHDLCYAYNYIKSLTVLTWAKTCKHLYNILYYIHSLTVGGEEDAEDVEEVKLSPADVRKYVSQFSGSVFQYDNLEMKEIIGEGLKLNDHIHTRTIFLHSTCHHPLFIISITHFLQVALEECISAFWMTQRRKWGMFK